MYPTCQTDLVKHVICVRALVHNNAAFLFGDVHSSVVLAVWLRICKGDNTQVHMAFLHGLSVTLGRCVPFCAGEQRGRHGADDMSVLQNE